MRAFFLATALLACACPTKPATGPTTTGQGSATGSAGGEVPTATRCEDLASHVGDLYRAEAQQKEPKRVEEAVADNTAMVMSDCAKQPQVAMPCIAKAASVAELEKRCLTPLDDEGTEGEQ
jgi:hypothetical protein